MFYDFEEEEQKVLYEYELGDLPTEHILITA